MYVLVRLDLSETYRIVQGTHAVVQYAKEYPKEFSEWNNSTIVFVGVYYLKGLRTASFTIGKRNLKYSMYYEPDLDEQATAIACVVTSSDNSIYNDSYIFKDLKAVS
jgi:hypothetical protein